MTSLKLTTNIDAFSGNQDDAVNLAIYGGARDTLRFLDSRQNFGIRQNHVELSSSNVVYEEDMIKLKILEWF